MWWRRSGSAGDEHVLLAVVGERFAGEAAVEALESEAGDVDEPEPFVLGRPPEPAGGAVVADEVDPVVADGVMDGVRAGILLVLAVEGGGDPVVEGERVPGEPPGRGERGGDALEGAAAVGPGRQVQQGAGRAVDQRRGFAGDVSMPMTRRPVARATGIATRPLPTASSTSGPLARRASST